MTHSLLFGYLPIVYTFHKEWAMDANFTQTFAYYIGKNWQRFFPNETCRPPVIYLERLAHFWSSGVHPRSKDLESDGVR
jgi:hypothetical protein